MSVPKYEQETVIRWDAEDEIVYLYTANPPTRRKVERAGYVPVTTHSRKGVESGWEYRIPLADFRWRATSKRRKLTEAQKQAASARLKNRHAAQNANVDHRNHDTTPSAKV